MPSTIEKSSTHRPLAIWILLILTFLALAPALYKQVIRDPLEVAFVYPSQGRPQLDTSTYFALLISIFFSQVALFFGCVITGIGILKSQRWAWFFGIGLHIAIISIYTVAITLLPPYASNDRLATVAISLASLYLLSRRDVRIYLSTILPLL